jgi:hypothetical protein
MGHGKVWKSGTAIMPGFGATRKKARRWASRVSGDEAM